MEAVGGIQQRRRAIFWLCAVINAALQLFEDEARRRRFMILERARRQVRGRFQIPAHSPLVWSILAGDDQAIRTNLRVNAASFHKLVQRCGQQKRWGWNPEFEMMVFLFWLACGTSFRVVGLVFTMPRTTVFRLIENVLNRVLLLLGEVLRLPSEAELRGIGDGFSALAGSPVFLQCVGAIDGCHVKVVCPAHLHDQYINRKLSYSILLQAIVDHTGKFLDIAAGYPGSVHDARVLRNSRVFTESLYPPEGFFIIGDSGYPYRRHPMTIITPFKDPGLTQQKMAFNNSLSRARIVVERAFGAMKTRFRQIFLKPLEVKIQKATRVIAACVVLHNVCLSAGDVIAVDGNLPPLPPARVPRDEMDGSDFRNLMLNLFTLERRQQQQQQ